MYCKRNWLAEHRTPFIFLQAFSSSQGPKLNNSVIPVQRWHTPRAEAKRIPDRKVTDEETTPSCGHIFLFLKKESLRGGDFLILTSLHKDIRFIPVCLECPDGGEYSAS